MCGGMNLRSPNIKTKRHHRHFGLLGLDILIVLRPLFCTLTLG